MTTKPLGQHGPRVSAIGLGAMGMSDFYGQADDTESLATLHAALEAGITLIDTGDFYGMGHNELLIGQALKGRRRDSAILSVKFGALRTPRYEFAGIDNRPVAVKNYVAYSLKRLGVDYIDIYRPARMDPSVPIEDTVGAIKDLIDQGYVRYLGLSEMSADTVRRAHAITPVADLQIEYSLLSRSVEHAILPTLRELGIGLTAYGVLSRGLISTDTKQYAPHDFRAHLPRFQGDNAAQNRQLVDRLAAAAAQRGLTVAQLAIAWVAAQGEHIVPLVGARTRTRLAEALAASTVSLRTEEAAALAALVPPDAVAGTRYPEPQMAYLDSERK